MGTTAATVSDMTHHTHSPGHPHTHHEAGLADLLDLDAEVLGAYLDEVTAWAEPYAPVRPRVIADVGAGTGTGSVALARRFPDAEIVAVDRSASMLDRVRATAREHGLAERIRTVLADLDTTRLPVDEVDLAWAASSLHEVADPDRVLRDLHAGLTPGGLLVVVEMDELPRFLPDDTGQDRPGLEERCLRALTEAGWNAHPDWHAHLERAGFEVVDRQRFSTEATAAQSNTVRYASTYLARIRDALDDRLDRDDLDRLDRLLSPGSPEHLARRPDLTVRSVRTAWAARRP